MPTASAASAPSAMLDWPMGSKTDSHPPPQSAPTTDDAVLSQKQSSSPPCKLSIDGRRRWALTMCAHCRDYTNLTCVLTCYSKVAHHREVKLVTDAGVRESVGVLSETQQMGGEDVLPPTTGELGRIVRLNQDAVDRGLLCTVSCELCAGQPMGGCIDAGHNQQVRCSMYAIMVQSAEFYISHRPIPHV